jgi:hypothetical protein
MVFALVAVPFVGVVGCRSRQQNAVPVASASAVVVSNGAPSSQTSATPPTNNIPTKKQVSEKAAISPSVQRGRAFQAKGQLDKADEAFFQGLVSAGNVNLQALAELAYLRLSRGGTGDTLEAAFLAAADTSDSTLAAQSWFNLATLYSRSEQPEAERAALARSLRLRDHQGVRNKLGRRSPCTVEVSARVVPSFSPSVVQGWVGVCKALQRCRESKNYTADEARKEICVTQGADASATPEVHGCEGEGPWESVLGYMTYTFERAWISEFARGQYFVVSYMEGAWPVICRGSETTSWSVEGDYVVADSDVYRSSSVFEVPIPQEDPEKGTCIEPMPSSVKSVWNRKTGKLLAAVESPRGESVTVELVRDRKRLQLKGGSCSGYIPLDGSMRLVEDAAAK